MSNLHRRLPGVIWLFLCLFGLSTATQAAKSIDLNWLKLSKEAQAHWVFSMDETHPGKASLTPQRLEAKHKILALVPKKSKSYSLALSRFLELLARHREGAEITLVNFGKNSDIAHAALQEAESSGVNLIFSMGSESAAFLSKEYSGGRIPVVTSTNKDPVQLGWLTDYKSGSGNNIAYTSLNIPLDVQIRYLKRLKPDLKAVVLMFNHNHKQVMATEVRPARQAFRELGIEVIEVSVSSRNSAVEELHETLPVAMESLENIDPGLDNSLFWITSSTAIFSNVATINEYTAQVPVLGSIPNVVSEGDDSAVLAIGIDRRNNAHLASLYALRILKGEASAGDLPVGIVTPPDIAINFRVAQRIGLKIPFEFFESAAFIYDYQGRPARNFGQNVKLSRSSAGGR